MLTLHHLDHSRSQRVLWLLEELDLPYEIKLYTRDRQTMLGPAELKKVHPLGKSPVITDGELTLAESAAILEYLLDRYGSGRLAPPAGSSEYLRFRYWMHYAEGSAMPPLLLKLVFDRVANGPMPFFVRPVARAIANGANKAFIGPQLKLHLDYMESELGKSLWFAGDEFSAADIQMSFPLEAAQSRAGLDASRPRLSAFLQRIRERHAYQQAIARGGPVMPGR
ncbi:glutathione S-transferase [Stutzerimonas stutzeri]|uniref:glutathione S-transferase n=1 Tax=Stutzerimonas TaxID=2901164 RepID=UPI001BAE8559|nr:glutathione S-transferase [Stutzerimonas stutzeri]QUE74269.1 glutathione S-transferase [Stutzerimonas stutzeri]